jgi:hypothetical protein
VRLGPAGVHAQQHFGPILRLGAAAAGMDLEIAVVAVGLARKQAFKLAFRRLGAQFVECRFGFLDDRVVTFRLTELDELDRVVVVLLDTLVATD